MANRTSLAAGASGFEAEIELSTLDGANGFELNRANAFRDDGRAVGDETGYSVSVAADVNGDGFDDVTVGAPGDGSNPSFPDGRGKS